ncbi:MULTISPECIES: hypothetical protein [unclassified Bradyrhizobium]|uniref:hypothetical protein n=1 Tax=unclassified Bradyrhizobium TaxID=2631580 RepID=UPI001FF60FC1|nr:MULTISPECIES: hypothetical protein [unclassified Bradyrhizobium]MCJ9701633.1 hypothetical protein [Bradyrhizobium sp. SHOUNA76]MCJ9729947.1 hypothetical protein [Bradyrhizobium sp. PRIMUS42]
MTPPAPNGTTQVIARFGQDSAAVWALAVPAWSARIVAATRHSSALITVDPGQLVFASDSMAAVPLAAMWPFMAMLSERYSFESPATIRAI